jgi:hypothetical protein
MVAPMYPAVASGNAEQLAAPTRFSRRNSAAVTATGCRSNASPQRVGAATSARRRGPKPRKFEQARDAMKDDIQQGRLTAAQLDEMLEKNLSMMYGVSRDVGRKARSAVLSEFGEN